MADVAVLLRAESIKPRGENMPHYRRAHWRVLVCRPRAGAESRIAKRRKDALSVLVRVLLPPAVAPADEVECACTRGGVLRGDVVEGEQHQLRRRALELRLEVVVLLPNLVDHAVGGNERVQRRVEIGLQRAEETMRAHRTHNPRSQLAMPPRRHSPTTNLLYTERKNIFCGHQMMQPCADFTVRLKVDTIR
eukprot:4316232-Pleurochrysis_carterae.AAC.2